MSNPDSPRRRTVRSFVLRGGRTTPGQERALTELWPVYGCDYSLESLELNALFGRKAPRLLEIGFGTGDALLEFAAIHPEFDCLGVEVHRPGAGHLLMAAENRGLTNLRVVCHDAVEVLKHQIPPQSLDRVHIFFPDPWPKKRHHKRRLIQPAFLTLLSQALVPGGVLRLATDWEEYALHMQAVCEASGDWVNSSAPGAFAARPEDRPITRFERRGQRLGHPVWDLEYRRAQ